MRDYIKQLEEQNDELKNKLAKVLGVGPNWVAGDYVSRDQMYLKLGKCIIAEYSYDDVDEMWHASVGSVELPNSLPCSAKSIKQATKEDVIKWIYDVTGLSNV